MRVFLTGGTGFVGGAVARLLCERGDAVRALVRDPSRADGLRALGCEIVEGDLSDEARLVAACRGTNAVVHCAGAFGVGVPPSQRSALVEANVCGTERMLGAALAAGICRAVYVSSVAVFGNTRGEVAGEGWTRSSTAYSSVYEETAVLAHRRALELGARGLPLVVVQPGVVYGPGDRSTLGDLVEQFLAGRLPALPFPDLGITPVHRDDLAEGIVLALDKGAVGESYVLAGEPVRMRELVEVLGQVSGRGRPRLSVPTPLLRALAPAGRFVGPALGFPPNLRELISCCADATFWASADKAADELGWQARPLRDGLQELVDARG